MAASPFVDLHADLDVPVRVFGYRPDRAHAKPRRVRPLVGHLDFPRIEEAGFTAVVYDIATQPFRTASWRARAVRSNLRRVRTLLDGPGRRFIVDRAGYDAARAAGEVAYLIGIQGANAFSADPTILESEIGSWIHRITLVHLTNSDLGSSSSPYGGDQGLTELGRTMIEVMAQQGILLDLAHASKRTFWQALDAHRGDRPPIVSHTGVSGVRRHWRNVDDDQIRAIADRGGVIGIMYQSSFLEPVRWSCRRAAIVEHLEHLIAVGGETIAAIGTDYDGFIVPPTDMLDVTDHPLLVQDMLDRGWTSARIERVLGGNALRLLRRGSEPGDQNS